MSPSQPQAPPPPSVSRWRQLVIQTAFVGAIAWAWYEAHTHAAGDGGELAGSTEGLSAHGFRFVDTTSDVGIEFTHEGPQVDPKLRHIEPQIAGTGASISVVDFDADGDLDLYTTTMSDGGANALYRREADGTYVNVAADVGLEARSETGLAASHGSLWADLDRDGDVDVLVYGWGRQRLFLQQEDGVFTDASEGSGLEQFMNCSSAVLFDFDRNGLLDVLLGGYYRETSNLWQTDTTEVLHDDSEFARNGGRNFLFRNLGGGRFEDVTDTHLAVEIDRWTYGLAAADFDGDGWQDLYVANDYGAEELFLNREGKSFESQDGLGLNAKSKSGMCVALGDVTNKGEFAVYVTNISEQGWLFQGNNLRINRLRRGGDLPNISEAGHGAQNCGWAWGAAFGDLDLDGDQDLVVVNGFRSADPDKNYWYQMDKVAGATGALISDANNWPAFEDLSLSGFQQSNVLLNYNNGKRMIDVAAKVGVEDVHDGRAVVLADLDDDGDLDMAVANQWGPLLVYENRREDPGNWIGFRLEGTTSNPDAVGAELVCDFGSSSQLHVVTAGEGFCSQGDPRIHVGLGDAERPDAVRIRWPSGTEQVLAASQLEPGRYHQVKEPTP